MKHTGGAENFRRFNFDNLKKYRFSIGFRFLSLIIAVTLLAGGITSFTVISLSRDSIRGEVLAKNFSQAQLAAVYVSNYTLTIQNHLTAFSNRPDVLQVLPSDSHEQIQPMLLYFAEAIAAVEVSAIYDTNGIQRVISSSDTSTVGQSFADREWFQQVMSTRQPYQSPPVYSRLTGNIVMPYAVPIMGENNQVFSIVTAGISLDVMAEIITGISYGDDTRLALIDIRHGGIIMVHTDPARVMTAATGQNEAVNRLLAGEYGSMEVTDSAGNQVLGSYTHVPGLPWGIVLFTPVETAFSAIDVFTRNALLALGLIVLAASLFGYIFSKGLTRPLGRLVQETQIIGSGNLDYPITTNQNDEVGDVSRAIASMAQNLKATLVSRDTLMLENEERKRAQKALKYNLERFQQVAENANEFIWEVDESGLYTYASPVVEKMLGYKPEELTGRLHFYDLFTPDTLDSTKKAALDIVKDRKPFVSFTNYVADKAGNEIVLETSGVPFFDEQGTFAGYRGIELDVTARKKAEQALTEEIERRNQLFDQAPVGIVIVEPDTSRFIEFNRFAHEQLGYSREEFARLGIPDVEAVEPPGEALARINLIKQQGNLDFETVHRMKNGGLRHTNVISKSIIIAGRTVFQCIWQDITERKRAFEQLAQNQQFLASLTNSLTEVIFTVKLPEREVVYVNDAVRNVFGYEPDECIGKNTCFLYASKAEYDKFGERLKEAIESQKNLNVQKCQLKNSNDEVIMGEISTTFLRKQGVVFQAISIVRDITQRLKDEEEQKQLRYKAEASSRLATVGEMAAGIAHEINNPLTSVIGFSQLLLDEDLPPEIKSQLKTIADGSNRVKDIIKRMLTFARQVKPHKTKLDIHELLDTTLELRSYVLRTANIDVTRNYEPGIPWVFADPSQLQQVFMNLIVNAEQAMKKNSKGNLAISAKKVAEYISIVFEDNGPGMSPETISRLFDPFFTTKDPGEGTGLGLSLSNSIMLEHGGSIEVESEPGKGSRFILRIPVMEGSSGMDWEDKVNTEESVITSKAGEARVLVVDDEPVIRVYIRTILEPSGYHVTEAISASDALKQVLNGAFDVLLMDIRMPKMSGIELYSRLSENQPDLASKIVFITGDASDINTQEFLREKGVLYITKPFDKATLLNKIGMILAKNK